MTPLIPRHALVQGRQMLEAFPCLAIQGARQSGKSTLARMLVEGRSARTVSLDDAATRAALVEDPRAFLDGEGDVLVIDEVQREPELLLAIKAIIDRDRRPGRFILTGSADLLRAKGVEESLAGRVVDLHVRPLSQGELLGHQDDFVARILAGDIDVRGFRTEWARREYLEAMVRGGYPEVQHLSDRMRMTWIRSYLDRVLSRDIEQVPGGGNSERVASTLRLLAANQSGELVKARLAEAASYPETMVQSYVDALSMVYLLDVLRPWTPNLTSRETGRRKVSVADAALAMYLTGQTVKSLTPLTSDKVGPLFEGFVVSQLFSQRVWSEEIFDLYHYRDRGGREVDIVVELFDGRVIGIEVKSSSTYRAEHFKGLSFLKDKLGDRFIGGFVLGMADHGYQFADRLYGLPAAALWS